MKRLCVNRHQEATNAVFVDWSVTRIGLKQLWTLKWSLVFDTQGPWTTAGGAERNHWPLWMRDFRDY